MYRLEFFEDSGDVIVAVGMPYADAVAENITYTKVGKVHVFKKSQSAGVWVKIQELACPSKGNNSNAFFGTSVSLHNKSLVIGAPGLSCAFIYRYKNGSGEWVLEQKISWDEIDSNDRFGDKNAVAVFNNWVVVGAKGAEAIFIYKFNVLHGSVGSAFGKTITKL